MKGLYRLFILIAIAIVGGTIVLCIANNLISQYKIDDTASRATIVAGVITFLGTIFATIYKEISTYYTDKNERGNKRWDLVLPMIKENYMPWISAASSLSNSFKSIQNGQKTDSQVNRILFLFTIFYGIRLRNLQKNGGYILLSSSEEEDVVDKAYQKVKSVLNWAGDETPNRVNELQELFITNEEEKKPYSIVRFEDDLNKRDSIKESKKKLEQWLTTEKAKETQKELDNFIKVFKESIKKLSSYWDV